MISSHSGTISRVLVIGATGRLGRMLQWGWRARSDLAPVWQSRRAVARPGWVQADPLGDAAGLAAVCAGADAVLLLAGTTPGSGQDLALNRALALAARDAAGATPLLVASSASVYGRARGPCREDDRCAPGSAYGRAKLTMEQAVLAGGGPVTCLRIGNVAGADQILGQLTPGAPALVLDQFPDGRTPRRSYVGPAGLARILADLVALARAGTRLPPVLNLACPGTVEMGALLDAVPHGWTARPAGPDAIAEVALDTTRLAALVPLGPGCGQAPALVAEWRDYAGQGAAVS